MRLEKELLKGVAPAVVMELLAQKPMYGYELSSAIEQRSKNVFELGKGTLYPLLYNLEGKRLVRSQWQAAPSGRNRRYYSLTAKGQRELVRTKKQLEQLQRGLNLIFQPGVSPA